MPPTEEEKKAATQAAIQAERDSIKVTTIVPEKDEEEIEVKSNDDESEEEVEAEVDDKEDDKEEVVEEGDDDKVAKEAAKEEEKEETKEEIKDRKKQERIEKKFAKERQAKKALEAEVAELRAKLASDGKEGILTAEDVEREATRLANSKLAEDNERKVKREFINACNKLAADATKIDKDFVKKINDVAVDDMAIPSIMIGILEEFDNGGAVLNYLANNEEEYEAFFNDDGDKPVPISSGKMAAKLSKISAKLMPKPKIKEISKVPEPNKPIGGGSRSPNILHDKMSDEEWIKQRNKDVKEKQAAGRYNLR